MRLDALAGNAALKRQLSAQAAGRGLSHAYLLSGPPGSGKTTLARLLSAAMVCVGAGERPCGTCPACKKALAGIHPDVIWVDIPEGKRGIVVDQARQIRADAAVRPNEGERKVYVVKNAQTMNLPAQNALLKVLEEGPAYAAFLLLTDDPAALLPTIRSRCEGLSLSPVEGGEARAFLSRRFPDKSADEIAAAARQCGGILGRAVERLSGTQRSFWDQAALPLIAGFAGGEEAKLMAFCLGLEQKKPGREDLCALLDAAVELLREALALSAGAQARTQGEDLGVARLAARLPRRDLLAGTELLQKLRRDVSFNVNPGNVCGALCAGLSAIRAPQDAPHMEVRS